VRDLEDRSSGSHAVSKAMSEESTHALMQMQEKLNNAETNVGVLFSRYYMNIIIIVIIIMLCYVMFLRLVLCS
jgi:CHASE3 domain sensor protein